MARCLLYPAAMKLLMTIVAVLGLGLTGCGQNEATAGDQQAKLPAKPIEPQVSAFKARALAELAKLTEFKDAMCKCHDRACATKVLDAHQAWSDAQPPDRTKPGPGEESEMKARMTVVFDAEKACIDKALAPPRPKLSAYKAKALQGIAKLTELKDAMCKCPQGDGECVARVMLAQQKWSEESANAEKPGPGEQAEMMALMKPLLAEHKKCMTAALTPTR